jgi:hypothetical protein
MSGKTGEMAVLHRRVQDIFDSNTSHWTGCKTKRHQ